MRRSQLSGRRVVAGLCAALSALVLAAGAILLYLRVELLDEQGFADRTVAAVRDPQVRATIADRVVVAAIDLEPDLLSARPLLESAVRSAIDTPAFEGLVRAAAINAHRVLFDEEEPTIAVDVADAAELIVPAVRSVDPELAEDLPSRLEAPLATLDRRDFASDTIELAEQVRFLAVVLPLLGIALLGTAVWLSDDRGLALRRAPLAVAAAGGLVLAALALAEPDATRRVQGLTLGQANEAIDDSWDALLGPLRTAALATSAVALGIALLVAPRASRLLAPLAAAARSLTATPRGRAVRGLRGVGLVAAGAVVVTADSEVVQAAGLVLGGVLVAWGSADVIGAVAGPVPGRRTARLPISGDRRGSAGRGLLRPRAGPPGSGLPGPGVAAALALLLAGGAIAAAVLSADDGEPASASGEVERPDTCNGSADLCERRLNEVVFAGTHNSMSAADEPGWLFANQRDSIEAQLGSGIRLFLLDPHWGVPVAGNRVRTDLEAEGISRNRVAKALGPAAVRTADRLAGRVGAGSLSGARQVWLCHSLCELGATKMSAALEVYRDWLDENPGEVLVLLLEPSVPAWAVELQFRRAGLLGRVARLRRDQPLPTLGTLLERGRQLVVLGERDTGELPWYPDAFDFIQDTPLGPRATSSCAPSRGDPDSPIFMLNHWVDGFPPRPSANGRVNSREDIVARAERCERRRDLPVSLIAVDHYDRGGVVAAADELNDRPLPQ
ncbi:MAG TPA: hypothetical protein VG126_02425 [Thermoleophilaceae bacterium]|nr:hypothetical protein [Thermoleophilaceae bacterium]